MPTRTKTKAKPWPRGLVATWHSYRSNCRRKNVYFELSHAEFLKLTQKNCVYCGATPTNSYRGYLYNGIDRKDNDRGYVLSNVVPCCGRCNSMKSNILTFAEMKRAMRAIQRR